MGQSRIGNATYWDWEWDTLPLILSLLVPRCPLCQAGMSLPAPDAMDIVLLGQEPSQRYGNVHGGRFHSSLEWFPSPSFPFYPGSSQESTGEPQELVSDTGTPGEGTAMSPGPPWQGQPLCLAGVYLGNEGIPGFPHSWQMRRKDQSLWLPLSPFPCPKGPLWLLPPTMAIPEEIPEAGSEGTQDNSSGILSLPWHIQPHTGQKKSRIICWECSSLCCCSHQPSSKELESPKELRVWG